MSLLTYLISALDARRSQNVHDRRLLRQVRFLSLGSGGLVIYRRFMVDLRVVKQVAITGGVVVPLELIQGYVAILALPGSLVGGKENATSV